MIIHVIMAMGIVIRMTNVLGIWFVVKIIVIWNWGLNSQLIQIVVPCQNGHLGRNSRNVQKVNGLHFGQENVSLKEVLVFLTLVKLGFDVMRVTFVSDPLEIEFGSSQLLQIIMVGPFGMKLHKMINFASKKVRNGTK